VFGTVSAATGGNQRLAILSVLAFLVAGFLLLRKVNAGRPINAPAAPASS
jgi:hypothetical protein